LPNQVFEAAAECQAKLDGFTGSYAQLSLFEEIQICRSLERTWIGL